MNATEQVWTAVPTQPHHQAGFLVILQTKQALQVRTAQGLRSWPLDYRRESLPRPSWQSNLEDRLLSSVSLVAVFPDAKRSGGSYSQWWVLWKIKKKKKRDREISNNPHPTPILLLWNESAMSLECVRVRFSLFCHSFSFWQDVPSPCGDLQV